MELAKKKQKLDLAPATLCTMKYPSLYRKHKYDEEENERYKKAHNLHTQRRNEMKNTPAHIDTKRYYEKE